MPIKPKVLIADDECVIADTLVLILKQNGFEATAVYSGENAVEVARTLRPDAFISDVIMAGMSGIDAAIRIQEMLPLCKTLLLSGQTITSDLLDLARNEGYYFEIIAKPVPPEELLRWLGDLRAQRLGA
jgi:CheY-like chemotaxis protein